VKNTQVLKAINTSIEIRLLQPEIVQALLLVIASSMNVNVTVGTLSAKVSSSIRFG
jgi:hypothetical protein